mgnify:CR=1 FL=1
MGRTKNSNLSKGTIKVKKISFSELEEYITKVKVPICIDKEKC